MKTFQKCNLRAMEFCAPMLAHSMGKFADGTLEVVSGISPESGRESFAHEIVFRHAGPEWPNRKRGMLAGMIERFGYVPQRRTPRPLRLNFCPWCGAGLTEPGTGEA